MQREYKTIIMPDMSRVEHEVRVLQQAKSLDQHGYAVTVLGFSNSYKKFIKRKIYGVDCISFYLDDRRTGIYLLYRLVSAVKMMFNYVCFILRSNYDVYHAHNFHTLLPCLIVAKIRKKRIIYDTHESWPIHRYRKYHPEHILSFLIEKMCIPFVDAFITVNELVGQYYKSLYCIGNPVVLYNTRNLRPLKKTLLIQNDLGISPDKKIVLFQGGFHDSMRGIYELIDAAPYISDNCVIVFIGYGPKTIISKMKNNIDRLNLGHKIFILPPKPADELMDYTFSADIGMNLIKRASRAQDFQSPWKLFEYCMAGLAVISTDLPFHRKVYQKYPIGFLIGTKNDPKEIAEKVNTLASDQNLLRQFKKAARHAAEKEFCWEKQEPILIELYEKLNGNSYRKRRK